MQPVFIRLFLMVLFGNLSFAGGRLALLLAAKELGGTPIAMGLLIALASLPGAITGVWVGRWFDRYDAGKLLGAGCGMMLASALLVILRFELDAVLVAGAIMGMGSNLVQIGSQGLTGEYSTDLNRTRNYNFMALALSLSLLFGPVIAGFSIDYLGYAAAFGVLGLLSVAGGLAVVRGLPQRVPRPAAVAGQTEIHVLALLREPGLRRLFILEFLFATGWDALAFLVPVYGTQLGLSASVIGMIASSSSLATLLIRLFVPAMARRLGSWRTLALALALTGGGFLAFPFFSSALVLGVCAFFVGAGLGVGMPIAMTLIYELAPKGRAGEIIGLRMALMRATHTVLPLASGQLGALVGLAPVFWLFSAMILWGAWSAQSQARASRREKE